MECPHCGKMSDEVIDSRPIKEGVAIRRRRRCLNCQGRFTTYESTEDQLPSVMMKKGPGQGGTITHVKTVLTFTSKTLRALTEEMGSLIEKVDRLSMVKRPMVSHKTDSRDKNAVLKAAPSGRASTLTATDQVLNIVKRHKKGVHVAKLKARTGFDDSKIGNILYRASKEGRVKRVSRGLYVAGRL